MNLPISSLMYCEEREGASFRQKVPRLRPLVLLMTGVEVRILERLEILP
jgi:hypothetical protein